MKNENQTDNFASKEYKFGFVSDIESDTLAAGLNEKVITAISAKKDEPKWLLDFRIKAYKHWLTKTEPTWPHLKYKKIDFQKISYYSAPKKKNSGDNKKEIDPEMAKTFEKLGIPLFEQKLLSGVAVDAIFDSVSVVTTHQDMLEKHGIIFCSISEAVKKYPALIQKYLGSVVPYTDNFYASLNSAVFTDGSFCYIPKGVTCPIDLSTYFRINASDTGQFERTLIVADEGSKVNYLEGCTAPQRDENQLHAAIVELVAHKDAEINYSTVQNWYAGDQDGKGGIYNFVTKRAICKGENAKVSWTQVEVGSSITWKYPSIILKGDHSSGEFYSVALTNNKMQADTGTKMIHLGKNTRSRIISKGISAEESVNSYRGLVRVAPGATNARNYTQCDSLLVGSDCEANTFPYLEVNNNTANVEHEASTSKISDEQIFYLKSRGISSEEAISLLINGFCKDVFKKLPLEFSVEAVKLLEMKLEGSIG